jgi:hypothetical protein
MSAEPRISMSVEFQRADLAALEGVVFDPTIMFTFEQRLVLIATQIIKYRHMQAAGADLEAFALEWRTRLPEAFPGWHRPAHAGGASPSQQALAMARPLGSRG